MASRSLRVRVYAGVDVLTGRELYLKRVVAAGPAAWELAEQARVELVRQVREGRHPRTNASLVQLLERYLAVAEIEPRGRETLRGYLRKHIAPLIGDVPIGNLGAETLDSYYAELRRCRDHCDGRTTVDHYSGGEHECTRRCRPHVCRPLAAGTIRHIHYLISGAYRTAIRWDWVAVNPMARARKSVAPRPDPQPPAPAQAAALVNESWRRGFGPLVWVAMTTGARRGELCALRWGHLQADHAVRGEHDCATAGCRWNLVIRRALGESHRGEVWEKDTKAHQRRHVALDLETVAVLLDHRHHCDQLATRLGAQLTDDHYVFAATPDGTTPSRPSTVSQRYDRCARRLGIKTSLKSLRHYSATELITAGVDVRTVAGRLGHYDATTTLRVYAAWVSAADQHASTVLMNRMPQRPAVPDPTHRARTQPTWPHEQVAAALHDAWRDGGLAAGTELTIKTITQAHAVSIGTAHRAMTLLQHWGVVQVRSGRPTIVLPYTAAPDTSTNDTSSDAADPGGRRPNGAIPMAGRQEPAMTATTLSLLRLTLLHLGTPIRTLNTQADPQDFPTLQRLLADAVRRVGGDHARIGEYELEVHLTDQPGPVATVVIAA